MSAGDLDFCLLVVADARLFAFSSLYCCRNFSTFLS